MSRSLYELCGAKDQRFSPYCWRSRLALAHKGLDAEMVPIRFTEKAKLGFSGQKLVPVLVDDDHTIADSWKIARYLDEKDAKRPLLENEAARSGARFVGSWADRTLHPAIVKAFVLSIVARLDPEDAVYFRETREKRFGMPLEDFADTSEAFLTHLRGLFGPVRDVLADQPFLAGQQAGYADYTVAGTLAFANLVSDITVIPADDPIAAWYARVGDASGVGTLPS